MGQTGLGVPCWQGAFFHLQKAEVPAAPTDFTFCATSLSHFLSTAHLAGDPSAAPSPGPKAQIPTHDVRAYCSLPYCSSPCSLQVGLWYVSLPPYCFLLLLAFTQAVLCLECSSRTILVELLHALFGLDIWPPEIPSHSIDLLCI